MAKGGLLRRCLLVAFVLLDYAFRRTYGAAWAWTDVMTLKARSLVFSSTTNARIVIERGPVRQLRKSLLVQRKQPFRIYMVEDSSEASTTLLERFHSMFSDQFDRWRFLQKMLDEETSPDETNALLFLVLKRYNERKSNPGDTSDVRQTDDDEGAAERLARLQRCTEKFADEANIPLITQDDVSTLLTNPSDDNHSSDTLTNPEMLQLMQQLESLLPTQEENADAYKSTWDTVIELHGREGVKINERKGTLAWKKYSLAARLMLHYDFLVQGLK